MTTDNSAPGDASNVVALRPARAKARIYCDPAALVVAYNGMLLGIEYARAQTGEDIDACAGSDAAL